MAGHMASAARKQSVMNAVNVVCSDHFLFQSTQSGTELRT